MPRAKGPREVSEQSKADRDGILAFRQWAVQRRIALFIHMGLVVHILYGVWYAVTGAIPCLCVDLVSVGVYTYLAFVRRRFHETDMLITSFEILVFSSMMIVMLGAGTCFELFIFGMNSIMFLFTPSYGYSRYIFMGAGFALIPLTQLAAASPVFQVFEPLRESFRPYLQATWNANYGLATLVVICSYALFSRESTDLMQRLSHLSSTDQLTGLHNRRHLEQALKATQPDYALAMADIDNFKRVNDTYGHAMGDVVLKAVAGALTSGVRKEDEVVRWGGEEFVICLPGCPLDVAREIVEGMRVRVEELRFDEEPTLRVTATFGLAMRGHRPLEEVIEVADAALYQGKRSGKNRVMVESAGEAVPETIGERKPRV